MLKIIFIAAAIIILAFVLLAMMCAMIVAGRSDEQADMENNEGADDVFLKKQICPRCKTGKYTYDLDPKSETCPYIGCWRRNKCSFYKPLEKSSKTGIFKRNKNKVTVTPPRKIDALCGEIKPFATI